MKEIISTMEAPAAIGAYSQAVKANGMLFASGQLGINPETGEFAGEDFRSQAEQAVKNVAAILKAAGTDASHVIKTTRDLKIPIVLKKGGTTWVKEGELYFEDDEECDYWIDILSNLDKYLILENQ